MTRKRCSSPSSTATTFPAGAEVEVSSNDSGLKGSWYEATVVRPDTRRRVYVVDYLSLVPDDDPSRPLRERAHARHVRPRPPRPTAAARYAVHELVDAFHNDGWWVGVVSAEDGGRYTVCFPGSREVIEFSSAEIRPHVEWRHGQWFPHQKMAEATFGEGEQVEVSGDKENYDSMWITGTVVKVIAKNIYLVEYKKPKMDGNHDLLREFLDEQYVRPITQTTPEHRQFDLHEEVEVCLSGMWVVGVVSRMVDSSRYTVKLRSAEQEELDVSHSDTRRHRKWNNGQWLYATKRLGRSSLVGKIPDQPLSVSSSSSDIEQMNPKRSKTKMREGPNSEGKVETQLLNEELKKGDPSDNLLMEIDPKTPALAALQGFKSPPSGLVGSVHVETGLRESLLFDQLPLEQRLPECNTITESVALDEEPCNSTKILPTLQNINRSLSFLAAKGDNSTDARGNRVSVTKQRRKLDSRKQRYQSVSQQSNKHSNTESKKKRSRLPKESTENISNMDVACKELQQHNSTSSQVAERKETNEEVNLSKRDLLENDGNSTKANKKVGILVAQDPTPQKTFSVQDGTSPSLSTDNLQERSCFANGLNDIVTEVRNGYLPQSLKEDCALAQVLPLQMASISQDDVGTSASFLAANLKDRSYYDDGSNDPANDVKYGDLPLPLKKDCAVVRSSTIDPRVGGSFVIDSMDDIVSDEAERISHQSESLDVTEKNQTSNMPPLKRDSVEEVVLTEPSPFVSAIRRTLPFVKQSCLWELIGSMEVFRMMPQRPHFRALVQKNPEDSYEGMAIGLMVTFANLEDDVRKLGMFDSLETFEKKMNSIGQLEENGFDVQRLRSRIEELLEIRNNVNELQYRKTTTEEQLFQRESVKDLTDKNKYAVDVSIMVMEKHLRSLTDQRESLAVQQLSIESEISQLQKNMGATHEAYLSAEQRFHRLVTSPW